MALITCHECNAQVSSEAAACPKCGAPIKSDAANVAAGRVVTTQQTSKVFKVGQLLAALLMVIGVVSCSQGERVASASWWIAGVVLWVAARLGAWWRNG